MILLLLGLDSVLARLPIQRFQSSHVQTIYPNSLVPTGLPESKIHKISLHSPLPKGLTCQVHDMFILLLSSKLQYQTSGLQSYSHNIYKSLSEIGQQVAVLDVIASPSYIIKIISDSRVVLILKYKHDSKHTDLQERFQIVLAQKKLKSAKLWLVGQDHNKQRKVLAATDIGFFQIFIDQNGLSSNLRLRSSRRFTSAAKITQTLIKFVNSKSSAFLLEITDTYKVIEQNQFSPPVKIQECPQRERCLTVLYQAGLAVQLYSPQNSVEDRSFILQKFFCEDFYARKQTFLLVCRVEQDFELLEIRIDDKNRLYQSRTAFSTPIHQLISNGNFIFVRTPSQIVIVKSQESFAFPLEDRKLKRFKFPGESRMTFDPYNQNLVMTSPTSTHIYFVVTSNPSVQCSSNQHMSTYILQLSALGECPSKKELCHYQSQIKLRFVTKDGVFSKSVFVIIIVDLVLVACFFGVRAYLMRRKVKGYDRLMEQDGLTQR